MVAPSPPAPYGINNSTSFLELNEINKALVIVEQSKCTPS